MAEINFKFTTADSLAGKAVSNADLIAMNPEIDKLENVDATADKLGSTYKGNHIIGTTEAKKLCLNDEITVRGVTVGNLTNGTKLKKGASLQEILQKILCKTIDVTAIAPTATLNHAGAERESPEYGSIIPATAFEVTLTQGEFVGESGYSYSEAMDCKLTAATVDGQAATLAADGMSATYTKPSFVITATTTVKGTASVSANTVVPVKNDGTNSAKPYTGGAISVSGQKTWTPIYKAFYGYSTKTSFTSADIRALNAAVQNASLSPANVTMFSGDKETDGTNVVMACPPGYKFVSIKDAVSGSNLVDKFKTATVAVTCGSKSVNYTVYYMVNTTGNAESYKEVVIGKA